MKINDIPQLDVYVPHSERYSSMTYRRCGNSGLLLPALSLGLWHNFGENTDFTNARTLLRTAFDSGITHFDLANNYGPPYGSAESTFGRIFKKDFAEYRDELIISSKAGYDMWAGPYGNHGSRKYLIASLNQSLKRMGLEYVDIFYHHRPDYETPLEETMDALYQIVRSGKALYVGVSNYPAEHTEKAYEILKAKGIRLLIHQPRYNMIDRWCEPALLPVLKAKGVGSIAFSPLEQGILTDRYLTSIPKDSRVAADGRYLNKAQVEAQIEKIKSLKTIADQRGQSVAQLAIAWLLKDDHITSVLIGASKAQQIKENIGALDNLIFAKAELEQIDALFLSEGE